LKYSANVTYYDIIILESNIQETCRLEAIEVARRAVDIASDKQAGNIVLLDVRGICGFADYFVICAGDSARQIRTILEEIELSLKKEGVLPHHQEGTVDSGWLLLDYGDVIVHIFRTAERDFYNLDELWHEARTVIKVQ
jgi:ribosome-associated protein